MLTNEKSQNSSDPIGSRGAAFIEATLIIPIFFTVLLALIEFSRVGFLLVANQFVAVETARWALLGQSDGVNNRVTSIALRASELSRGFGLPSSEEQISICPMNVPSCPTSSAGTAGSAMLIQVKRSTKLMFLNLTINIEGSAPYVNEP